MRFFDRYARFYETAATSLLPNRFEQRWRMIVERNAGLLRGARILDLASHDGRWSFAALKAGAAQVVGVEARPDLVRRAGATFEFYQAKAGTYAFLCQDAVAYLSQVDLPRFDVVLNLGFLYHTMRHMEILENMARTGAPVFIIDTGVDPSREPVIRLRTEAVNDPRNAVDHRGAGATSVPVGFPSRAALALMLDSIGYEVQEVDWAGLVADFSECADYRADERGTFIATRRVPV